MGLAQDPSPGCPEVMLTRPAISMVIESDFNCGGWNTDRSDRLQFISVNKSMSCCLAKADVFNQVHIAGCGELMRNHAGQYELAIPRVNFFTGK